jgi:5-methylcytosine-specific restriction endonuclease McrA
VFCKSCDEFGMYRCPEHGLKERTAEATRAVRSRLKESERQKIRQAFLAGVKAERMERDPHCAVCGTDLDLELHHHPIKRSQGQGYRDGVFGVDDPTNLVLLCRKHHREAESNPMWSAS